MRYILHSDLNNFYASVECLYNPNIRNKAVVVVGDWEKRHGIVLSKNYIAKAYGVKTGEPIWEAKQKIAQELVCVKANFELYGRVSVLVKDIYRKYSDRVESFGIDEAWIDISQKAKSFEEAVEIAHTIRKRVLSETGLTVSIGVSFNKIFAKLGSDLKKPNAVTLISPQNFKQLIFNLPVQNLIYVGRATLLKFNKVGIKTIGDLASAEVKYLKTLLGKNGETLYNFANGLENSEVKKHAEKEKSIGNSTTCPRDLTTEQEVRTIIYNLAEKVAERLRAKGWWCEEVALFIRDDTLSSVERQKKLEFPTMLVSDIARTCMQLFNEHYTWQHTIRALGVRVGKLCDPPVQYNFFVNENTIYKKGKLEQTVETLRGRYGYNVLKRACVLKDLDFTKINPNEGQHIIHPISFF